MTFEIWATDKITEFKRYHVPSLPNFIQKTVNRMGFGSIRYDPPAAEQKYMDLILKEWKAYKRTGNCEHLYNMPNYCYLESIAPQNKKFHFKEDVKSVRRV